MKLPNFLAYKRSFNPGNGFFYQYQDNYETKKPVIIKEETLRTVLSNEGEGKKAAKLQDSNKNEGMANVQTIQSAYLDADCNTLCIDFSLQIQPDSLEPFSCNDESVENKLKTFTNLCEKYGAYQTLSKRYAERIACGDLAWRNQMCRELIVEVKSGKNQLRFHPVFEGFDVKLAKGDDKSLEKLAKWIEDGLTQKFVVLDVRIHCQLGFGSPVYPSQEFTADTVKKGGRKISRVLASVPLESGEHHAVFHAQKLGNALRRIDRHYLDTDNELKPIAVEPFGIDQQKQKAYREPNTKKDFYNIFKSRFDKHLLALEEKGASEVNEEILYFLAVLIRGGVFSRSKS